MSRRRRSWGSIRQLESGRWQARFPCPQSSGLRSMGTFKSRSEAEDALDERRIALNRGVLIVDGELPTLEVFAAAWLAGSAVRPRTRQTYQSELRHVLGSLGHLKLDQISTSAVRRWRADLLEAGGLSPNTVAKVYKRLAQIMAAAVDDGLLPASPCRIRGASAETLPELCVPDLEQVIRILDHSSPEIRAMVAVGAFCGLRFGECVGLTVGNVDLAAGRLSVELRGQSIPGGWQRVPLKTAAGIRTIVMPELVVDLLRPHLFGLPADALVFTASMGGPLTQRAFAKPWREAKTAAGVPAKIRFHDLRHFHGTLLAQKGASLKEIMRRHGQRSPQAALRYVHATEARDQELAASIQQGICGARPVVDGVYLEHGET